MDKAEVEVIKQ